MKSKLMSEGFLSFTSYKRGRLLEVAAQIGELVVAPNLLQAKLLALFLVPRVVEVKTAGILAAVLFGLVRLCLQLGSLRGLGRCGLLFGLVQLGGGHEYGQLCQSVLGGLVAGDEEDFGIEVGISVTRNFLKLQRVLVAVVGDDMHVRRRIRRPGLDADEAAGDVAAVEDPIHGVAAEDVGDFLLGRQQDERRLQQAGTDHGRSGRFGHRDRTRSIRLKVVGLLP